MNILVILIKLYQKTISPFKQSRCPFTPTCSNYAVEAIGKYGSLKGLILGAWRILRCNPFNKGYYDPPEFWADKIKFKKLNK